MNADQQYELFRNLTEGSQSSRKVTLPAQGGEFTFNLSGLDRHTRYRYMSQMSDDFMGGGGDVDIPEDAYDEAGNLRREVEEELASEMGITMPDEQTVIAFENLVIEALTHSTLVQDEIAQLIRSNNVSDKVIFELGGEIINFSMNMSEITEFRID